MIPARDSLAPGQLIPIVCKVGDFIQTRAQSRLRASDGEGGGSGVLLREARQCSALPAAFPAACRVRRCGFNPGGVFGLCFSHCCCLPGRVPVSAARFQGLRVRAGGVAGQGFLTGWGGCSSPPQTSPNPLQLPFLASGHLSHVPCCHRLPLGDLVQDPGWHRPRCSALRFWEQRDFGVVQSTQKEDLALGGNSWAQEFIFFFNSLAGNKSPARGGKLQLARGKPASSLLERRSQINNRSDSTKKKTRWPVL